MNKEGELMFYLNSGSPSIKIDDKFKYYFFKPSLGELKLHNDSLLLYMFWFLFSKSKMLIFYIEDKETGEIAHYSNVLPKIFKFPFMKKGDFHIVNCQTNLKFRGNNLYPFALSKIIEHKKGSDIWIGTRKNNIPSVKGIEKAGFKKISEGRKSDFLGVYKLLRDE